MMPVLVLEIKVGFALSAIELDTLDDAGVGAGDQSWFYGAQDLGAGRRIWSSFR